MPPERTSSGFGAKLRDARERRGVTLRQIANATKISVGVLDALERNDISKLPGGIFGRAFVRSYAIEVGLDPEATILDFIAQFPSDSVTIGHPTSAQGEDNIAVESDRQTAGTFVWLIAIAVPLAAGLMYFTTIGRSAPPEAEPPPAALAAPVTEARPITAEPPPMAAPVSTPPAAASAAGATTPAATTPAGAALAAVSAGPRPSAPAPAGDQLTVALTAKRPCWVSATVDGQKAIERLLQTGEQQTVTVRRDMVLTAGDASAIALQFNGADARPLGKSGEVVTARFNLTNYKDFLQAR
jgi:cytoskeleton protein RodZ